MAKKSRKKVTSVVIKPVKMARVAADVDNLCADTAIAKQEQKPAAPEAAVINPDAHMTLAAAMDYVKDNYDLLINPVSERHVLGLIATPDDPDTDFCIFELSCTLAHDRADSPHNTDKDGKISDYYHIHLQGGVFFNPASVSVFHGGVNAETLLASMPPQLADVRFTVYTLADGHKTHTTEQALFKIFPSLPDPDKLKGKPALHDFKRSATTLINKSNL